MIKSIFVFVSGLFIFIIMSALVHAAAVDLAWDPPEDGGEVEGYIVYTSTIKGDYSNPAAVEIFADTETYGTVTGLNKGRDYYFIAKAYNCAGIGEASNEVYVEANSDAFYDDESMNIKGSGGCFMATAANVWLSEPENRSVAKSIGISLVIVAACFFRFNRRKR